MKIALINVTLNSSTILVSFTLIYDRKIQQNKSRTSKKYEYRNIRTRAGVITVIISLSVDLLTLFINRTFCITKEQLFVS